MSVGGRSFGLMPPRAKPLLERVMCHVDKQSSGCWQWTGSTRAGYGQMAVVTDGVRKTVSVHRLVFELVKGPIPDGLDIDHQCHDETCPEPAPCHHCLCVNPEHLEPATRRVNVLRGRCPAADNARKTQCPEGHQLEPDPYHARRRYCPRCKKRNAIDPNWELM